MSNKTKPPSTKDIQELREWADNHRINRSHNKMQPSVKMCETALYALNQLLESECSTCNGSGQVQVEHYEQACCGNALPNGDCCGDGMPEQQLVVEMCADCQGTGTQPPKTEQKENT